MTGDHAPPANTPPPPPPPPCSGTPPIPPGPDERVCLTCTSYVVATPENLPALYDKGWRAFCQSPDSHGIVVSYADRPGCNSHVTNWEVLHMLREHRAKQSKRV